MSDHRSSSSRSADRSRIRLEMAADREANKKIVKKLMKNILPALTIALSAPFNQTAEVTWHYHDLNRDKPAFIGLMAPAWFSQMRGHRGIDEEAFRDSLTNRAWKEHKSRGNSSSTIFSTYDGRFIVKTEPMPTNHQEWKLHTLLPDLKKGHSDTAYVVMQDLFYGANTVKGRFDLKRRMAKDMKLLREKEYEDIYPNGIDLELHDWDELMTTLKAETQLMAALCLSDYSVLACIENVADEYNPVLAGDSRLIGTTVAGQTVAIKLCVIDLLRTVDKPVALEYRDTFLAGLGTFIFPGVFFTWPPCDFYLCGRLTRITFGCKDKSVFDPYGTCVDVRRKVIHGRWYDWVKVVLQYDAQGNPLAGFLVENTHW
ncbi:unnamed protein product, partial [Mesorhabditis spiculigera]